MRRVWHLQPSPPTKLGWETSLLDNAIRLWKEFSTHEKRMTNPTITKRCKGHVGLHSLGRVSLTAYVPCVQHD